MRLFKKPTRDPLPADHSARVLAHYLTLCLLLLIFLAGSLAPSPSTPESKAQPSEKKSEPWYEKALEVVGKLL